MNARNEIALYAQKHVIAPCGYRATEFFFHLVVAHIHCSYESNLNSNDFVPIIRREQKTLKTSPQCESPNVESEDNSCSYHQCAVLKE